jgi:hypothetical protein
MRLAQLTKISYKKSREAAIAILIMENAPFLRIASGFRVTKFVAEES